MYTVMILWSVTIDGVWIDDRVYWTYNSLLHFTNHCNTQTRVFSLVLHYRCLVAASTADVPVPQGSRSVPHLRYSFSQQ
jgi:hypothetical protein